jgi:hypothetical protein
MESISRFDQTRLHLLNLSTSDELKLPIHTLKEAYCYPRPISAVIEHEAGRKYATYPRHTVPSYLPTM